MQGDDDDELKTPLTVKTKRDKEQTEIKTTGYKLDLGSGFKKRMQENEIIFS